MNNQEINTLIATEIRNLGINDVIDFNKVKNMVFEKIKNQNNQKEINEVSAIENPEISKVYNNFPYEEEDKYEITGATQNSQNTTNLDNSINNNNFNSTLNQNSPNMINSTNSYMEKNINDTIEPKLGIIPEVPDFLKDVEPSKIFVYDFNELNASGENLSYKPLKTLEYPEISKTPKQMWMESGITKTEVYQAKFEKVGEIFYDYKSDSSKFVEDISTTDVDFSKSYKDNPYVENPKKQIEDYIHNNYDLNKKIEEVITNIVKKYFTNIDNNNLSGNVENHLSENFDFNYIVNNFKKINSPEELIEAKSGKNSAAILIESNNDIEKWKINDKEYFIQKNPMSIKMCYII